MNVNGGVQAFFHILADYLSGLLDVVYPPVCGLCGRPADSDDRLVCLRCWESICGLEAPYCVTCRQFLPDGLRCPVCADRSPVVFSLGFYDETMQTLVHDLKFYGFKPLAASLGERLARLIADYPRSVPLDIIVPVPLHHSRRHARGFNQSEELARSLSDRLSVPLRTDILYATRRTRQQARLSHRLRERNVRGAFAVDDSAGVLAGARVLLVDDVTTTGATLRENARVLSAAGAETIIAAVVASAV